MRNPYFVGEPGPSRPTVTSTSSYDTVIAQVMRAFAVASVALAKRKAYPS